MAGGMVVPVNTTKQRAEEIRNFLMSWVFLLLNVSIFVLHWPNVK